MNFQKEGLNTILGLQYIQKIFVFSQLITLESKFKVKSYSLFRVRNLSSKDGTLVFLIKIGILNREKNLAIFIRKSRIFPNECPPQKNFFSI